MWGQISGSALGAGFCSCSLGVLRSALVGDPPYSLYSHWWRSPFNYVFVRGIAVDAGLLRALLVIINILTYGVLLHWGTVGIPSVGKVIRKDSMRGPFGSRLA